VAFDVEHQRAGGEPRRRLGGGGFRAAQQGLRAEHQLARVERLRHVIVGAGLEALHLVDRLAFRREEDHRRILEERVGPDHAEQLHAREFGHHHVEDDQVRAEITGEPDGAQRVVQRADGIAGLLELIVQ